MEAKKGGGRSPPPHNVRRKGGGERKSVLGGGNKRKKMEEKEKGAAIKGHQSQPCLVNSPFLYTMKSDVTHRRPLPSHTNSPS